ncbi:MAG: hypothetical protein ACLQQ4_06520 [Bacteroidia bacterium]
METKQEKVLPAAPPVWIIEIALQDGTDLDIEYQCLYSGTREGAEQAGIAKAVQLAKHHFGPDLSDDVIEDEIKVEVFEFTDVNQLDFMGENFMMLANDLAYPIDGRFGALD